MREGVRLRSDCGKSATLLSRTLRPAGRRRRGGGLALLAPLRERQPQPVGGIQVAQVGADEADRVGGVLAEAVLKDGPNAGVGRPALKLGGERAAAFPLLAGR